MSKSLEVVAHEAVKEERLGQLEEERALDNGGEAPICVVHH